MNDLTGGVIKIFEEEEILVLTRLHFIMSGTNNNSLGLLKSTHHKK